MKITEKLYVYKGQYGYSTLLKNQEDKLYVQVQFKKGFEPVQENAEININDGFLSFYRDKNGNAKPKIVILDYTEIDPNADHGDAWENPAATFDDSDLPF